MKSLLLTAGLLFLFWVGYSYIDQSDKESTQGEVLLFQPPVIDEEFAALTQEYVAHFKEVMNSSNTPGAALAIIKDDQVYVLEGMGVKKKGTTDPVDENTVFRLGSLSKGVIASLTGILVDKGTLEWSNKVQDFLADFQLKDAEQGERVNVKHLLSHTTGLPYHAYTDMVERGHDLSFINKQFKTVDLIAEEGEVYAYQNAVFSLIGEMMEVATGHHVSDLLDLELFQSLGMANASSSYKGLMASNNYAQPHAGGGKHWGIRKISKKYYNAIPAGGINASIADMAKYLQLVVGNRPDLLSEENLDLLFEPLVNTRNKWKYFRRWPFVEESYYGLGHRVVITDKDVLIYHGGYVNGYKSEISFNRKEKVGICVLTNAPSELSGRSIPDFWKRFRAYQAQKTLVNKDREETFLLPEQL